MVGEIEPFLTHPEIGKAITAEEAAQLLSMIAPLQKMCRKLNDYGVPDALIHGDLHGSNVARNHSTSDKLLFFDWTDSAISHPFFDMLVIYTEKDTAKRQTMRDAYLKCWQKYESQERLLELWRMAEALAAVYHGISYLYIFLGVEEWGKIDFYGAMPYWLRKILNYGDFVNEYQ
jgi:aminoglycoside phosphotransferase (APT) family kinase protein